MSDWGVHLLDYALEGMGADLPSRVFSGGGKFAYPDDAMETPDTLMATYAYKDFNIIWDHACGINHGGSTKRRFGLLSVKTAHWYSPAPVGEVIPVVAGKEARMEAVPFKREKAKAVQPCRKFPELHQKPRIAQSRYRYRCTCSQDVAPGKHLLPPATEVRWDDANSMFIGDNEATALSKAYYRAPVEFTQIVNVKYN